MTVFYAYVHARPGTTTPDGIFYVGKGKGVRCFQLKRNRNSYHSNIVAKHGADNILVSKIECSSEEISFELEKGLIRCFRKMGVTLSNQTSGGEGASGYRHTEAQKLRNSAAQKIAQRRPEVRAKHSATVKGRKQTPESNAKRSATLKIKRNTKEYHDRHSAAIRGKKQDPEHVRKRMMSVEIAVKCVENGMVFKSSAEAGRWCVSQGSTKAKFPNCGISRASVGLQKSAFGFHWEQLEPIITEE